MTDDISTILFDSLLLLAVGMTVVFFFLSILIVVIHAIEWISKRLPEEAESTSTGTSRKNANTNGVPPQIVAAIGAAIHQHRNQKN